jgi:hypothetical protein
MAPYARWVLPSFRTILIDHCNEFLASSDRGNDKARTKLISQVSKNITDIAQETREAVLDNLEKVITNMNL